MQFGNNLTIKIKNNKMIPDQVKDLHEKSQETILFFCGYLQLNLQYCIASKREINLELNYSKHNFARRRLKTLFPFRDYFVKLLTDKR